MLSVSVKSDVLLISVVPNFGDHRSQVITKVMECIDKLRESRFFKGTFLTKVSGMGFSGGLWPFSSISGHNFSSSVL